FSFPPLPRSDICACFDCQVDPSGWWPPASAEQALYEKLVRTAERRVSALRHGQAHELARWHRTWCCIESSAVSAMQSGVMPQPVGEEGAALGLGHHFLVALEQGKEHSHQLARHATYHLVLADILALALIKRAFARYQALIEPGKLVVAAANRPPCCQKQYLLECTHAARCQLGVVQCLA